jgi:ribosomal-protein-alanine N-acetyltransferase
MNLSKHIGEFPVLETERLVLRELRDEDAEPRLALLQDADVMRYLPWFPPKTVEESRQSVRNLRDAFYRDEPGLNWAITLRGGGELVGCMKYWRWFGHNHRIAELGYESGKAFWGRGYMTEAMRAAVDCGFRRCGLRRCQLTIDPRNGASMRVAEKVGFRLEGILRGYAHHTRNDEWHDLAMLSILKTEWPGPA